MTPLTPGDIVSLQYEGESAYGVVIWLADDKANIDFKNPKTREGEVRVFALEELTKIGSYRQCFRGKGKNN